MKPIDAAWLIVLVLHCLWVLFLLGNLIHTILKGRAEDRQRAIDRRLTRLETWRPRS